MNVFISDDCNEGDISFIRKKLVKYNSDNIGSEPVIEHINFILQNDNNEIVGGITGIIYMECLSIELLWVSDELRGLGYGKKLLNTIEDTAKSRKCKKIVLDTFDFQAPDFYKRNGYSIYATLEDFPVEKVKRFYLKKEL